MNRPGWGLVRDAAALGSANVLSRIIVALWLMLAARLLGVSEFGRFSVLFSVLLTAQAVADAGLSTLVTRRVSKHGLVDEKRLVASSFALQGCIAIAVALGTLVVTSVGMNAPASAAAATATGAAAACMAPIAKGVLRATRRFGTEGRLQILSTMVLLLGTGASVAVTSTASQLLWTYALVQVLTAVTLITVAVPWTSWGPRSVVKRELRNAFAAGLPFNIMSTASLVYLRSDVFALGWARSDTELGHYSAAVQVYQGAWILGSVLAVVSLPRLVRRTTSEDGDIRLRSAASSLVVGMLLLGGFLGVVLLVTAPRLVPILFGVEFERSGPLLQVLACSMPLVYANFALGQVLIAMHRERVTMLNALLLAAIALVSFPPAAAGGGTTAVALVVVGLTALSTVVQAGAVLVKGQRHA